MTSLCSSFCTNTSISPLLNMDITIMQKQHTKKQKMTSRRAVAPVIATLLLVAIAVVGGSIIFVFSQGFFSSAQVSGSPQIESLEIVGYDMTDGTVLQLHDGFCTAGGIINDATTPCPVALFDGDAGNGMVQGDRFAVYLQNQSVNDLTLTEVLLAGAEYLYQEPAPTVAALAAKPAIGEGIPEFGEYIIVTKGDDALVATIKIVPQATLEPGEEVSLLFAIDDDVPLGRDVQLKLTTANGNVFVTTLISGSQSG